MIPVVYDCIMWCLRQSSTSERTVPFEFASMLFFWLDGRKNDCPCFQQQQYVASETEGRLERDAVDAGCLYMCVSDRFPLLWRYRRQRFRHSLKKTRVRTS